MLDDIDLKINNWIVNTVNSLIKPNKLDKIAECALELSKIIYYNNMNIEKYLDEINLMQKELNIKRERSNINFNRPTQIIELINEYMFKEKEFKANIYDYQNPLNNFLNIVIEKRIGIPITLSIIYITLAQSINFKLYPVNFPRHFLVKYVLDDANNNEIIIDPFNQGRIMDDYALKNLIDSFFPNQNIPLTKKLIEKANLSQVIIRILNNVKDSFFEIQEFDKLNIANEMILAIDPKNTFAIRDKGIILHEKDPEKSLELLNRYLELEPEANDVDIVLKIIKSIREKNNR
ncbi:MAG TPA: transglutaminase-like domain-containing protein [Nitrososphaeraceae archaeon]|nr:transglutaminase-like domain-containing protein [Nitrososphaeraceae archaeon]